jgi:hypothetical protein
VQTTKLTITGLLVADALANADVEFMVGAQRFTAKADAQRQYNINLDILPENQNTPLIAKAMGVNSSKWIQFATLLPSVKKLQVLAGTDGILKSDEFFGVNISALTTAEFVLANESKRKISTDEERKWALLEVSTERQREMAATLNIFLTDVNFSLPKNAATTLDFLLDANTATAYINLLKLNKPSLLNDSRELISVDANQTTIAARSVEGTYLIQSSNVSYLLDFNKDGTGRLQLGNTPSKQITTQLEADTNSYVDIPTTWVKQDKLIIINFVNPVIYPEFDNFTDPLLPPPNNFVQCGYSTDVIPCKLSFTSISLTLVSDNEFNTSVNVSLEATVKDPNGSVVYNYADHKQFATMWSTADFYSATAKDLVGFEWYMDVYKYVFNLDGTAVQTDLRLKQTKTIDWKIENGRAVLDSGSIDLWLTYPTESGFTLTQMKRSQINQGRYARLSQIPMVKRQVVKMTAQDWVGRWTAFPDITNSSFYDVYSDGHWRDGFLTSSAGSWSALDDTKQTALSNGDWRMQRDVLAIYDGRYYIQICQGFENNPVPIFCNVEMVTKDTSFTGSTFWGEWSYPVFHDITNDNVWIFDSQNTLNRSSGGSWITQRYIRISADRLYDFANNKILQLISSSTQTADVCEYSLYANCSEGTLYKLERGIEVIISKTESGWYGGNVYLNPISPGSYPTYFNKAVLVPKNKQLEFQVTPNSSTKIDSMTGCGGSLNGNIYIVPGLTAGCEISVIFAPI